MSTREAYVRYSWRILGMEVIAGLEWRADESVDQLWRQLRGTVALALAMGSVEPTADGFSNAVEEKINQHFPDRAYFIEVSDGEEKWTQVFDPKHFFRRNG